MEYRPLNDEQREIRLLTVERTSSRSKHVTCKLHRYSMDRLPPYTALSYCWGDPTDTITMIVNGKKFSASRNLEAALRQISRDGYSTIWADAICINQEDNNERNHQILFMREIYSAAECVIAWLGPETPSSMAILNHLESLEQRKSELLETLGDWGIGILPGQAGSSSQVSKEQQSWITFSGMSQASREERREVYTDRTEIFLDRGLEQGSRVTKTIIPGFQEFFDRPYWTRVWIIQEVAVASRVIVYCGSKHTKMENIEKLLVRTDEGKKLLRDNRVPNFTAFRKSKISGKSKTLLKLLMSSRSSLATDPRDKVYALLGLSSDSKVLMNPDYQKPLDVVLEELTRNLLLERKCANILLFRSGGHPTKEHLPSWIPDWLDLSSMNRPWHSALAGPDGKIPRSATERFMLDFEFPRNLPGSSLLAPVYNRLLKPKPVFFGTETPEWKEGSSLQQWIFAQDPCLMNSDGPNMPFVMPSIKIRGRILKIKGYIIDQVDGISAQAVGKYESVPNEELERRDMLQPLGKKSYYTKPPIIQEDWDDKKDTFTYNESTTYQDKRPVPKKRSGSRERSVSQEEPTTDEDLDASEGSVVDEESHEQSITNKTTARAIAESFSMQRVDFGAHIGWGTRCTNPLGLFSALRKEPKDSIVGAWIERNLSFMIAGRTIEQWMQYLRRFAEFKKPRRTKKPALTAETSTLARKVDIGKEKADKKEVPPTAAADEISLELDSQHRKISKSIKEQSRKEQTFKARQNRYIERVAMVIGCGMRLITTEAGRVGMVHPQAEDEDLICHLRGCAMPVVLRRSNAGKGYHVVGEAYLWPPEDFAPSSLKVEEFKSEEEIEFLIE